MTIGAGEFKAKCLHLLDVVSETREEIVITKRGRPIARLVPMPARATPFGALRGSVVHQDDLIAPIDAVWDAE